MEKMSAQFSVWLIPGHRLGWTKRKTEMINWIIMLNKYAFELHGQKQFVSVIRKWSMDNVCILYLCFRMVKRLNSNGEADLDTDIHALFD